MIMTDYFSKLTDYSKVESLFINYLNEQGYTHTADANLSYLNPNFYFINNKTDFKSISISIDKHHHYALLSFFLDDFNLKAFESLLAFCERLFYNKIIDESIICDSEGRSKPETNRFNLSSELTFSFTFGNILSLNNSTDFYSTALIVNNVSKVSTFDEFYQSMVGLIVSKFESVYQRAFTEQNIKQVLATDNIVYNMNKLADSPFMLRSYSYKKSIELAQDSFFISHDYHTVRVDPNNINSALPILEHLLTKDYISKIRQVLCPFLFFYKRIYQTETKGIFLNFHNLEKQKNIPHSLPFFCIGGSACFDKLDFNFYINFKDSISFHIFDNKNYEQFVIDESSLDAVYVKLIEHYKSRVKAITKSDVFDNDNIYLFDMMTY